MTDEFGHWLAGFIDGEGCFSIMRNHNRSYVLRFAVCVRGDDREIIEQIHAETGLGRVDSRGYPTLLGSPQVEWRVQRKADCMGLVSLLDRYPLRAKKARDYAMWRAAAMLWCPLDGRRRGSGAFPPEITEQLKELHDALKEGRIYREAVTA